MLIIGQDLQSTHLLEVIVRDPEDVGVVGGDSVAHADILRRQHCIDTLFRMFPAVL